ncbi:hypothetical protein CVT24_011160 [Panaeolus cyanescens]|uniref:Uncharacterized protein n=1 Tax=Panaeolus cyanescens TaxID=181874 RepID=A0A409YGC2_9AGAR|nr:hypothetical protein CVT24_011160 [Panaeolus cyanescens]
MSLAFLFFLYSSRYMTTISGAPYKQVSHIYGDLSFRTLYRREVAIPNVVIVDQGRTVYDILWACLLTIFSCTWIAIHPNVRGYKSSGWSKMIQRAELMGWAILAPEVMVMWAFRQWRGAKDIQKRMKAKQDRLKARLHPEEQSAEEWVDWTITHSHFLQMGGYVFKTGSKVEYIDPCTPRGDAALDALLLRLESAEEIMDRSKGDTLAKTFVVVQTFWFIIQCIVRGREGLVITELEITTLAHAAFNGLLYFFWWDKPLDIQCPVIVRLPETVSEDVEPSPRSRPSLDTPDSSVNSEKRPKELISQEFRPAMGVLVLPAEKATEVKIGSPSTPFKAKHEGAVLRFWHECGERVFLGDISHRFKVGEGRIYPIRTAMRVAMFIISFPDIVLRRLYTIAHQENMSARPDDPNCTTFDAFYAYPSEKEADYMVLVGTMSSALFGAVHCIAWAFPFSSKIVQDVWRINSLILCISPFGIFIAAILATLFKRWAPSSWQYEDGPVDKIGKVLVWIGTYTLVPYPPARFILVGLAFRELAYLPPAAFVTLQLWVEAFPHI